MEKEQKMDITEKSRERYEEWLRNPCFDRSVREELTAIGGDEAQIRDRFYKDLEFGTGGLRGVVGAGTNRMNLYTVRRATQGLANYILSQKGENKGVAIAFDSRHMSPEFARETALCLNANGIKTWCFETLRPTPELSFAVRKLGCIAGIVITASHNPPEYNGYKVYWEDGGQITPPKDKEIIRQVGLITDYAAAKTMTLEEARAAGLYQRAGAEIDDAYMEELKKLVIHPDIIREEGDSLKIVYTPLHGAGSLPVQRILKELGFTHVYVVPEQERPDGDFPTVSYPNPEDPNAFTLALKLAKEKDADLVRATDPDAHRLGIYVQDTKTGEYISFTGNMSGMLIAEYRLSQKKAAGQLPARGALVKTIVTTNMADALAAAYGAELIEVLTGFKYIGEQIKWFEEKGNREYVFGLEESYGCLIGTYARDKDAVSAVMALCEAAAYCKHLGITLWDQMLAMYQKYGFYREGLHTITLKGMEGAARIQEIMERLRTAPPKRLGGMEVLAVRDYQSGMRTDRNTGETSPVGLPASNVLYYELGNDSWCCARPSGTEPKIKFYIGVRGGTLEEADRLLADVTEDLVAFGG